MPARNKLGLVAEVDLDKPNASVPPRRVPVYGNISDVPGSPPLRPRLFRECFCAMYPDLHLDARAEPVEDRHEAIQGEPREICVADAREVGRRNAGSAVRRAHGQAFPV